MAINSLEYRSTLTNELDKEIIEKSKTGFLADNAFASKFVGSKTVMVPNIKLQGLGDYDRDTGFVKGSINISNTSYTLQQERSRTYTLDREDNDEVGVAEVSSAVLSEFVRTKVAPEMDAYNISKLASKAIQENNFIAATSSPFKDFNTLVDSVRELVGGDEELVAFMPWSVYSSFKNSSEITRMITTNEFKQGDVNLTVKSIDGVTLIPVEKSKMYSAYEFYDGATAGQTEGGFKKLDTASLINMLVLPKKAAMLVKKTEKLRIWTPDQNIDMDAYKFDYRLYYDMFVRDSYAKTIFCSK